MQIQQGMERLRTAAPEVFQSMGFPQLPPNLVPPPAPAAAATPTSPSSGAPAAGTTPAPPAAAGLPGQPQDQMFSQFMTQMMGQMRAGNPDQPPEERFASQLDQLASMGFVDRQANIQGGVCFVFYFTTNLGNKRLVLFLFQDKYFVIEFSVSTLAIMVLCSFIALKLFQFGC